MSIFVVAEHSTWKMGELREEFLGQDHTPEFLEGAMVLENCDILEQGIQHRRGGIQPYVDVSQVTGVGTHSFKDDVTAEWVLKDYKFYEQGNRTAVAMCWELAYWTGFRPTARVRKRRVLLVTGEEDRTVQQLLRSTQVSLNEGLQRESNQRERGIWRGADDEFFLDGNMEGSPFLTPGFGGQFLVFWGAEGREDFSAIKFRFEEIGLDTWAALPDPMSGMGLCHIRWSSNSAFPLLRVAGYERGFIKPSEKGYFGDSFDVDAGISIDSPEKIFKLEKGKIAGALQENGHIASTTEIGNSERVSTFGQRNVLIEGVAQIADRGIVETDAVKNDLWWYVRADIQNIKEMRGPVGVPNYVMILMEEKDGRATKPRYFLAEVLRNLTAQRDGAVFLGFMAWVEDPDDFTKLPEPTSQGENEASRLYMFQSRKTLFNTISTLTKITTYCLPYFSEANGHSPASLSMVGGRAIMTTFRKSHIIYSFPGVSRYISEKVPVQFELDEGELKKIRDQGANAVAPPSTLEGEEALFYWLQQTGQATGQIPFATPLNVEDDGEVRWVGGQEGLIVGTTRGEIQVPVNNLITRGQVNYLRFLSKRGTNSSITARGDESIFFVGPQGDEIFQVDYRQERSGPVSRSSNYHGGDFIREGVVDMKWDFQRKALWVIYGDGKLALYFKQREYGQMAWVRYVFRDGFRLLTLVRRDEGGVGFIANDLRAYDCPLPYRKDYTHFQDRYGDGEEVVFDWVSHHICSTPRATQGEAAGYRKRVSEVLLRTAGVSRLLVGGDRIPTGSQAGNSRQIFDITEGVVDDGVDYEIPFVKVVHKVNERGRALSISRRLEVLER